MTVASAEGLRIEGLSAGYNGVDVLHGIDVDLPAGDVAAFIGANGAGKSTLLGVVAGMVKPSAGTITWNGEPLGLDPGRSARAGVAIVPEGRRVFASRTIADNLQIGGWLRRRDKAGMRADLAATYERFPILGDRRNQLAGALSGGEAQMLAIGMALMARPTLLLLDEPSLGLAPLIVDRVMAEVTRLSDEGITVLLVEQIVHKALAVADQGFLLGLGRVVASGPAATLAKNPAVSAAYLGG